MTPRACEALSIGGLCASLGAQFQDKLRAKGGAGRIVVEYTPFSHIEADVFHK